MFSLKGQVINTFTVPGSEKYPEESFKVQFLGDQSTKDGQIKKEMVTMGIPADVFKVLTERIGKTVSIPIGLFVTNGRIQPFFAKGKINDISTKEGAANA